MSSPFKTLFEPKVSLHKEIFEGRRDLRHLSIARYGESGLEQGRRNWLRMAKFDVSLAKFG